MVGQLWVLFLSCFSIAAVMTKLSHGGGNNKVYSIPSILFFEAWLAAGYLGEHGVELLARAIVASLGQELLDLLPHLILVQMPAVVVVDAGARRRVRRA